MEKPQRVEIIVSGLVQGVGFRYFVLRKAAALGVRGYVKNLYTGEVLTIAEGERHQLEALLEEVKIGPTYGHVSKFTAEWSESKNEFYQFDIRG